MAPSFILRLLCIAGHILQISAEFGGCSTVCGLCFSNGTCSSCLPYTTLHNGTCEPCGRNCVNCTYQGFCRSCEGGYGPIAGTTDCDPCSQSPGCSGVCDRNGAEKCDACRPGYRLDNADCKPCISNCRSCSTNLTYCDSCNAGYYTFPGNKTCGQCSAYCTVRKSCNLYGAETCDQCDPGFYWTPTKSCGPCAANCSSCSVGFQCDICRMGFGLTSSNTCAPCSQNCVAGCNITGASKCDACDLGYGLTASGSCAPCSPNCTTFGCAVDGALKCDRCDQGFYLTTTNTCARTSVHIYLNFNESYLPTLAAISFIFDKWTTAMPTWTRSAEDIACPMLEVGLGLGVPCGFIIIVLLISIIVLCVQNRSLREYKKESQDSRQIEAMDSTTSIAAPQPTLAQYQQLKMQNTERDYEKLEDKYDTISTAETEITDHYDRTIN